MFDFLKKKNLKKEELAMTKNEEQIEKAKKDVAEKGPDSQTEKDRVDESVGEQEKQNGNENTQNAKDRVDESEGTKKADEKPAEEKKEETKDDGLSEKIMTAINSAVTAAVEKAVGAAVDKAFSAMDRHPQKASDSETEELRKIENIYN